MERVNFTFSPNIAVLKNSHYMSVSLYCLFCGTPLYYGTKLTIQPVKAVSSRLLSVFKAALIIRGWLIRFRPEAEADESHDSYYMHVQFNA